MRTYRYLIVTFLLCLGCAEQSKLTFEPLEINNEGCSDCPAIQISIPNALDATQTARAINTALREETIYGLSFEEEATVSTIAGAVKSFTNSYLDFREEFPQDASTAEWEAQVNGTVIFENDHLISISLKTYSYTGGAHGYGQTTYLNFDKQAGRELENFELFSDYEGFEKKVEATFRQQEKISENAEINDTGFMFEGNQFHLAENMGFTEEGLQIIYNQYEVASYAEGPIVLTIPYSDINDFLKASFQVGP